MGSLTQTQRKRQRQEQILSSLEIMKFATREQIQKIHNLGKDRNTLRILNEMKEFLQVKNHEGRNIYCLNAKGRELVGSETVNKVSLQIDHYLMRNDMWIYYYFPKTWRTEESVQFGIGLQQITIIPDATFTLEGKYYFLEVDNTQSMAKNKSKIETYSKLYPLFHKQLGHTPTVVFYTVNLQRKQKLKEYCQEYGVTSQIYTREDIY